MAAQGETERLYRYCMGTLAHTMIEAGRLATESLAETLWPTRCAVCDTPDAVLCEGCRRQLAYIDWWQACPVCGAPYGRLQCCDCNEFSLLQRNRSSVPFLSCASVAAYEGGAARLVRIYKDHGERRLAKDIARLMAQLLPPLWLSERPVIVGIPSTTRALRARGFDHMELIAGELAHLTGLENAQPLARPRTIDQRALNKRERMANTSSRFSLLPGASVPLNVLLVDDVYTTGSTLYAACDALLDAGARQIRCLTFARVF